MEVDEPERSHGVLEIRVGVGPELRKGPTLRRVGAHKDRALGEMGEVTLFIRFRRGGVPVVEDACNLGVHHAADDVAGAGA